MNIGPMASSSAVPDELGAVDGTPSDREELCLSIGLPQGCAQLLGYGWVPAGVTARRKTAS